MSETFWREFLHLYAHEKGAASTGVVDFTVGCGLLALASARSGIRYAGYCLNATHREAVLQSLTVMISLEIARNVNDGFLKRRVLSPERSLGGSADTDVIAAESAQKTPAEEPAAEPAMEPAAPKDDSSSLSSDE